MATPPTPSPNAAKPLEPGNNVDRQQNRAKDIREIRDVSLNYMRDNLWDELAEAFRAVRVRTAEIKKKDEKAKTVEDTNRTNVAMPELYVAVKKKTGRYTANPPNMRYILPGDDPTMLSDRLTARAYYEYDCSGEAWHTRRGVQQANTFGYTYWNTFYKEVTVDRQMRYLRESLTDRRTLMQIQGKDPGQIEEAISKQGQQLTPEEHQALMGNIATDGPELRGKIPYTKYSGPVSESCFIGDILLESECLTLNQSSFVIEDSQRNDKWLREMAAKTYIDPESNKEVRVFDQKAMAELLDKDRTLPETKVNSLKNILRDAVSQTLQSPESRLLPSKLFDIICYQAPAEDGTMWIEYVGHDNIYLGKQPVPFDLYGKFTYTEFVPWPDLINAFGLSSPRALRYLHAMHNAAVGQRTDLISNILRRTYWANSDSEIPKKMIRRDYGNVLIRQNPSEFGVFDEPDVPQSAWETEAQIKGEMQIAEPAIGGVEAAGTDFNPQSGKTATTAILQNKSSDVLIQLELDALAFAQKEMGEKKLEIHRQLADGPIPVPNRSKYVKSADLQAQYKGKSQIEIDPYEIQDPGIEVEPEVGSTLAVDDELKKNSVMQAYQISEMNPVLWNTRYMAEQVVGTMRGIDKTQALNPPAPPQAPPPKIGINISIPLDKMPPDIQQQVFTEAGLSASQDLVAKSSMDAVQHASQTADAVVNLNSPAKPDKQAEILKGETTKVLGKGQ